MPDQKDATTMKKIFIQSLAAFLIISCCASFSVAGEKEPRVKIDISGHPYLGLENAPVTLVVFSDYL